MQQNDHHKELRVARGKKEATRVEAMLGEEYIQGLLHLTQTRSEADLCSCCPVYKSMSKIKNTERMGLYQAIIDKLLAERGCKHLGMNVTPAVFQMFTSLIWYQNDSYLVYKGFLGKVFLMGPSDVSLTRDFNLQSEYVLSGKTSAMDANMQAILSLKINTQLDKDALKNVRRNEILCFVSLPAGHTFLVWIRDFIKSIENYGKRWRNLEMTNPSLQGPNGSVFLQYYSQSRWNSGNPRRGRPPPS